MDSDSDDDYQFMKPALGTMPLPDDFDPNKVPEDGEEYLHHVMHEARQLKSWVTVNVDRSKLKNTTFQLNMIDDNVTTPKTFLPNAAWQNGQLKEFDEFRTYLDYYKHPNPVKSTSSHWIEKMQNSKPSFQEMNELSQAAKRNLLFQIVDILEEVEEGAPLSNNIAMWLYSIFCTLEIPLSPEICYCIRDIARNCRRLRSHLAADTKYDDYAPYNLIICLAGRYFKQFDLADPL